MRITWAGLMGLPVVTVVLLAALNSEINLLYLIVGFAVAAAVCNFQLVRLATSGLDCKRQLPESASVGLPLDVTLSASNANRVFAAYALTFEDRLVAEVRAGAPAGFVPYLHPRRDARCTYRIIPAVRGKIEFREIAIRTRFPFGILQRKVVVPAAQELIVWPQRGRLIGGLPALGSRPEREPVRQHIPRPGADDFLGLRDYRAGENARLIHWRSSARRGKPVIREMEEHTGGRIFLILDTRADPADARTVAKREAAVSFAATIAEESLRRGTGVGLAAWGAEDRVTVAPGSGPGQRRTLLDRLALLPDNTDKALAGLLAGQDPAALAGALCIIVGLEPSDHMPAVPERLSQAAGRLLVLSAADGGLDRIFAAPVAPAGD